MSKSVLIVKEPLYNISQSKISSLIDQFESAIILSVKTNADEKLSQLVSLLIENKLSDVCIIDDNEIRIKRVVSYMNEKNISDKRIYFLTTKRLLSD